MTRPLPSLALDMSQEGIALHQLAFDGHWHELARVALTDPALRARLINMRSIAARLEGRRFKVQIWLPEDQILCAEIPLPAGEDQSHAPKARAGVADLFGGKPADYAVQIGQPAEGGARAVAAVRLRTLLEARTFAKSHGFRARGFSTRATVAGFAEPPAFSLPADKVKLAGLGLVAATAAALVLGGGYAFYNLDPFNLWESPPKAADFAPFQQPNPGIERAGAPPLPAAAVSAPVFPEFAAIESRALPAPLPYLPPRQLTADAQEQVDAPLPPVEDEPPLALQAAEVVPVNWPGAVAPLPVPGAADGPPSVGLFNLLERVTPPPLPEADQPPPRPAPPVAYNPPPRPMTVANTPFFLEPLPAMATRLAPDALADFISRSGLTIEQISRMAPPLLLAESKVVEVTPGLPPILPRLRSGRAIPEQVPQPIAPPVAEVPPADTPDPAFNLVSGRPDLVPLRRAVPPAAAEPGAQLPYRLINGAPDIRPRFRPRTEAATPPADTPAEVQEATAATTAEDNATLAAAVDAAVDSARPPEDAPTEFALIEGQPDLLPLLRSGAAIPPVTLASAANPDPAIAEANALRPRRRPPSVANIPPPIADPMISGAAPATATRPRHRDATFTASVARIAARSSRQPRVAVPAVPADPQSVNLPTSASVARAATIENAINLRKTNLLGIYGAADNRTALIMLSGGRMVRVQIGQSFSGWTVVAISDDTVRIRKRRREEILRMPAE